MTIDEAATYLNVPARWVADAVRQRKVRCTRIAPKVWSGRSPRAKNVIRLVGTVGVSRAGRGGTELLPL